MARTKSEGMTNAEFAKLRQHLRNKGVAANKLDDAVGATAIGRQRLQLAAAIIAWLKNLPKKM